MLQTEEILKRNLGKKTTLKKIRYYAKRSQPGLESRTHTCTAAIRKEVISQASE